MNYLCTNNILSDAQHGFRKSRSCETQLIMPVNDIGRSLNDGGQLYAALLDFSKAFDKVNHKKLCLKHEHYDNRGESLNWIKNYLSNKNKAQKVVVKETYLILLQLPQEALRDSSGTMVFLPIHQ